MSDKFSWGSHIPINKSILKTFNITGVLELGSGFHSTPLFFNSCDYAISVEQDKAWIKKLKEESQIVEDGNHCMIYQDVEPCTRATRRKDISKDILDAASDFFIEVSADDKLNFLFVDCYSGFRLEALDSIHHKFDCIVFHDVQPRGMINHSYEHFIPNKDFVLLKDTTFVCHSGILIKKELFDEKFEELKDTFEKEVLEYAGNERFKPILEKW